MGIASLIIGIVAFVLGLVPACGLIFGLPPAVVGLILGILEISGKSKKNEPKGMGVAGTILNALAIVVILVWTLVIGAAAKESAGEFESAMQEVKTQMEEMETEVAEGASEEMREAVENAAMAAEKLAEQITVEAGRAADEAAAEIEKRLAEEAPEAAAEEAPEETEDAE